MPQRKAPLIALCSAIDVAAGDVPEWIHLLPAGTLRTADGRGPYTVASMAAIAAQLKDGDKLPIDECHASDFVMRGSGAAPARGWIVALEARQDGPVASQGLWGKVEWTGEGQRLMADKAYRGVSPVILHTKDNQVLGVLRASLINTPNLQGLTALHGDLTGDLPEENAMDWKAKLIELLGLDSSADDAAIEAALKAKMTSAALCGAEDITADPAFIALQGELVEVTGKLNAQIETTARDKAVAFVDGAIASGRVGVKPMRDRYIALHMKDAAGAEEMIGALPSLQGQTISGEPGPAADEKGLDAGDRQVIALMGLDETEYLAGKNASGKRKEAL